MLPTPSQCQNSRSKEHTFIIRMSNNKQNAAILPSQMKTYLCIPPQCVVNSQTCTADQNCDNDRPVQRTHGCPTKCTERIILLIDKLPAEQKKAIKLLHISMSINTHQQASRTLHFGFQLQLS